MENKNLKNIRNKKDGVQRPVGYKNKKEENLITEDIKKFTIEGKSICEFLLEDL